MIALLFLIAAVAAGVINKDRTLTVPLKGKETRRARSDTRQNESSKLLPFFYVFFKHFLVTLLLLPRRSHTCVMLRQPVSGVLLPPSGIDF
jgi:hypothetical protein